MVKTVTLSGTETMVDIHGGRHAFIQNKGSSTLYVSKTADVTPNADGVYAIDGGSAITVEGAATFINKDGVMDWHGILYMKGSGVVQIITTNTTNFKIEMKGGDSGGASIDTYTKAQIDSLLSDKVNKVEGKDLSTEDFTTALKNKLNGLNNYNDSGLKQSISSLSTELAITEANIGYTKKNFLYNGCASVTKAGVTANLNSDKSITLNGTNDTFMPQTIYGNMQTGYTGDDIVGQAAGSGQYLMAGEWILSGAAQGARLEIVLSPDGMSPGPQIQTVPGIWMCQFTVGANERYMWTRLVIEPNASFDNVTIYPMIRPASIHDDTYEPYSPSIQEEIDAINNAVFGAGIKIKANTDIRSYGKPGLYICESAAIAQTLTACPVKQGFMLEVFYCSKETGYQQLFRLTPNTQRSVYMYWITRYGPSGWYKIALEQVTE